MKKSAAHKDVPQKKVPVLAKTTKNKPEKNKNTGEGQDEIPSIH